MPTPKSKSVYLMHPHRDPTGTLPRTLPWGFVSLHRQALERVSRVSLEHLARAPWVDACDVEAALTGRVRRVCCDPEEYLKSCEFLVAELESYKNG